MARTRRLQDAMEKYKGNGANDFFQLPNDKDVAVVRFLYGSNEDELDWFIVHEGYIGGKKRYVECPETEDCPFCLAGKSPSVKLFLQLIDYRDGKVKTWERGQKFVSKIMGLMGRYGNLFAQQFEIERNGKKGDTQTTYEIYNLPPDNMPWDQLPQKQELLGENGFVLQKSIPEMEQILNGNYQHTPVEGQRTPPQEQQQGYNPQPQPRQGYQGGYQPPQQGQYQQQPNQQPNYQQQPYQQQPDPQFQNQHPGGPFNQNNYQQQPNQQPPQQQQQQNQGGNYQQQQQPPQQTPQQPQGGNQQQPPNNGRPPQGKDVF